MLQGGVLTHHTHGDEDRNLMDGVGHFLHRGEKSKDFEKLLLKVLDWIGTLSTCTESASTFVQNQRFHR